jgi:hypothetical protein
MVTRSVPRLFLAAVEQDEKAVASELAPRATTAIRASLITRTAEIQNWGFAGIGQEPSTTSLALLASMRSLPGWCRLAEDGRRTRRLSRAGAPFPRR